MNHPSFKLKIFLLACCLAPVAALAQSGGEQSSHFNPVLLGLLSLMFLLALAIGLLGNTLQNLMRVYRGQLREKRNATAGTTVKSLILLAGTSLLAWGAHAQEAAAGSEEAAEVVKVVSPYISGILRTDFYVLMGVIALEVSILLVLLYYTRKFIRLISGQPEQAVKMRGARMKSFLDRFNKSVSVENEEAIVLDHEYDGIRELDNSLPPWWKWGFVATIIFSVVYMWYYHIGNGPSSHEEYIAAVEKAEQQKAAFLAKSGNAIDENNITLLQDPADLENGKTLFQNVCAACHAPDGGGSVGPNLADDYWLHGGSLQDVFKTIKYGVKEKGMPAWESNMSPKQLAQLTSYVKSLQGTKPAAPKAPQGDLFVAGGDQAIDSVSNATNPSLTPQPNAN